MYIDRELDRKHDEAIIKVEAIKKRMGWKPGFSPRSFDVCDYVELVEAEKAAEGAGAALVERARQADLARIPGGKNHG